jgi:hypothetical protein
VVPGSSRKLSGGGPTNKKEAEFSVSFFSLNQMESYCYIIYSEKLGKFYVGAYRENLSGRIAHHNTHFYGNQRFMAAATD